MARSDVGQPVDSGITKSCSSVTILSMCSDSLKAGRTGITRELIEKAIGELSNNRAELAISDNWRTSVKTFLSFLKLFESFTSANAT
jgi:hypothetical protein